MFFSLFSFIFGPVGGLLQVSSLFYVTSVLGEGRRNAMVALNIFMFSTLTL